MDRRGKYRGFAPISKTSSKVVNKNKFDVAKEIIIDCLNALNYSTEQHEFNAYLPMKETVEGLISHAINENLTPEELALLLIDAGFVDHNASLKSLKVYSLPPTTLH